MVMIGNWKRSAVRLAVIAVACLILFWLFAIGPRIPHIRLPLSVWSRPHPVARLQQTCPPPSHPFQYSEVPPLAPVPQILQHYASRIFSNPGLIQDDCERFTIIMMTYKRLAILPKVLRHYCKTPLLDKIIVIWNNVEVSIPSSLLGLNQSCAVPLLFIKEKENKMTNRFKARPEIITECVMIIDDDIIIAHDDLVFAFNVWQQFRQKIIGFKPRTHVSVSNGTYKYNKRPGYTNLGYSMTIGATMIMHRVYLEMFSDHSVLPRTIFDFIDKIMNCDDLAICVMVTKFLQDVSWPQAGVLIVVPTVKIENLDTKATEGFTGLWHRSSHLQERSDCLNKFVKIYNGTLHLHYTDAVVNFIRTGFTF